MATFGIDEANQLARQRTPGDVAAFISQFAKRGPLAAAAPRPATVSAPAPATASAPRLEPKPMTQDERDDAAVRDLRALAACVGMKGFGRAAAAPSGGSGGGDDDGTDLRRLAAAVGLCGSGGGD
jgi:hypothetical protein